MSPWIENFEIILVRNRENAENWRTYQNWNNFLDRFSVFPQQCSEKGRKEQKQLKIDRKIPRLVEAYFWRVHKILNMQKCRPPIFLAVERKFLRQIFVEWTVAKISLQWKFEENGSGDGWSNSDVTVQIEVENVELVRPKITEKEIETIESEFCWLNLIAHLLFNLLKTLFVDRKPLRKKNVSIAAHDEFVISEIPEFTHCWTKTTLSDQTR